MDRNSFIIRIPQRYSPISETPCTRAKMAAKSFYADLGLLQPTMLPLSRNPNTLIITSSSVPERCRATFPTHTPQFVGKPRPDVAKADLRHGFLGLGCFRGF